MWNSGYANDGVSWRLCWPMPFIEPLSSPSSTRPTESDRRDTGDPGEKALPPRKLASRDGAADDSGDTRPAAHDQSEAPAAAK